MTNDPQDEKLMSGHDYDGIQELDNDLPKWWLYGFYFTIVFSFVYIGYFHIFTDWSSHQQWEQEIEQADVDIQNYKETMAQREADKMERLAADSAALAEAQAAKAAAEAAAGAEQMLATGQKIFDGSGLCYTCHRNDGGGLVGPNLTDDMWIHGCDDESIASSIRTGFPDKGMVPWGSNTPLSDDELQAVVMYIKSMVGSNPANPKPVDARAVACE